MSILKKLGIALLVLILVLAIAFFFISRGDTADVPFDEVTGTDPTLDEANAETFPTVAIAEPVGWEDGEVPVAAEGLQVSRFAEGLDHPRTLYALPNGDILVSLTRSPSQGGGGIMGGGRGYGSIVDNATNHTWRWFADTADRTGPRRG